MIGITKSDITFTVLKPLKSVKWTEEAGTSESKDQDSGSRWAICAANGFECIMNANEKMIDCGMKDICDVWLDSLYIWPVESRFF